MIATAPLRDPATCRHAVHTADSRTGKDLNQSPVMRGRCMWCDTELKAPLGAGWGVGPEFATPAPEARTPRRTA